MYKKNTKFIISSIFFVQGLGLLIASPKSTLAFISAILFFMNGIIAFIALNSKKTK